MVLIFTDLLYCLMPISSGRNTQACRRCLRNGTARGAGSRYMTLRHQKALSNTRPTSSMIIALNFHQSGAERPFMAFGSNPSTSTFSRSSASLNMLSGGRAST